MKSDGSQSTLLNPPYDGHAAWHEHAFPPYGMPHPVTDEAERDFNNRYDAVEDRRGRIFVWSVGRQEPVCICAERKIATKIARMLARV